MDSCFLVKEVTNLSDSDNSYYYKPLMARPQGRQFAILGEGYFRTYTVVVIRVQRNCRIGVNASDSQSNGIIRAVMFV